MDNNTSSVIIALLLGTIFLTTSTYAARLPAQLLLDEAAFLEEALEEGNVNKRSEASESEVGSLWFGPRLGRRRRSPPEDTDFLIETEDGVIRAEALAELIREAPWALIALKEFPGGKRQTLTFTPRLGRDMNAAELLGASGIRSPPFSPRLGRGNGLPFSPRLGRQQEPTSTRVGRSAPDPRPASSKTSPHP